MVGVRAKSHLDIVVASYLLLCVGPALQQIVDVAITSRASKSYEAAYGNNIIETRSIFADYLEWPNLLFLFTGCAIAYLKPRSLQDLLVKASICAFVMWITYDGISTLQDYQTSVSFVENIFYNAIGSILFGLAIYCIIFSTKFIEAENTVESSSIRVFVALGLSISLSLVVISFARFILNPVAINFQATIKDPLGYYMPYEGNPQFEIGGYDWNGKPFNSPLPSEAVQKFVKVDASRARITADFSKLYRYVTYRIWLFEGCNLNYMTAPNVAPNDTGRARQIAISTDDEISNWWIRADKARIDYTPKPTGYMSVDTASDKGRKGMSTILHAFADDDLTLRSKGPMLIGVSLAAYGERKGGVGFLERRINLTTDKRTITKKLSPRGQYRPEKKVPCRQLTDSPVDGLDSLTVVMSLEPGPSSEGGSFRDEISLKYDAYSAVVEIPDLSFADIKESYLGVSQFVSLRGREVKLTSLEGLGGADQADKTLFATGKFDVRFDQQGRLQLIGVADRLWRGDLRITPTRWELLSDEWQRWLVAGFLGGLFAFLRWVMPVLWRERRVPFR